MLADEEITVIQSGSSNPHQDLTIFGFWGWDGHEIEGIIDCAGFTGRTIRVDAFDGDCFMHWHLIMMMDYFLFNPKFGS